MSLEFLALDGGGIKGTFGAAVLAALEEATKSRCVDHFDLIAGTSTGGIIALGIALGMTGQENRVVACKSVVRRFPGSSLATRSRKARIPPTLHRAKVTLPELPRCKASPRYDAVTV